MQGNVPLEHFDLLEHFVVRLNQLLRILRLVVQLGRQLVVLQNSQPRLSLQLLVIERHQISLGLLHLEIHLFRQLFDVFDLFKLSFVDSDHAFLLVGLEL